jgi:hypothetical protein
MKIRLNIYERGFQAPREGKAFEPQIWHRAEFVQKNFVQKNFVRFFSSEYLLEELYLDVPSVKGLPDSFSFNSQDKEISLKTIIIPVI